MESKNLKTGSEEKKVKAPPLIQEADERRAQSQFVSAEAHDHAGLAYLFELILNDPTHPHLKERLMQRFQAGLSMRYDLGALSAVVALEAEQLNMHPLVLASAMIWWGKEADLAENETVGSADWQLLPTSIRNHRKDLQEEFKVLGAEIEAIFHGSGLEPELAIKLAWKKCNALGHGLSTLLKSIQGHRKKLKRLFYANTKNEIEAYYLLRVRRLKTNAEEFSDLMSRAGESYDMSNKDDRIRAQKKLHEWAKAFESLVAAHMLDLGYFREKGKYVECPNSAF